MKPPQNVCVGPRNILKLNLLLCVLFIILPVYLNAMGGLSSLKITASCWWGFCAQQFAATGQKPSETVVMLLSSHAEKNSLYLSSTFTECCTGKRKKVHSEISRGVMNRLLCAYVVVGAVGGGLCGSDHCCTWFSQCTLQYITVQLLSLSASLWCKQPWPRPLRLPQRVLRVPLCALTRSPQTAGYTVHSEKQLGGTKAGGEWKEQLKRRAVGHSCL